MEYTLNLVFVCADGSKSSLATKIVTEFTVA